LKKRVILITGKPGTGKTTALLRTVQGFKDLGYSVGGMVSREVRSSGIRVGFEVWDLNRGRKGWLAHVNQGHGPRVGKYRVDLGDLDDIGVNALSNALEVADVIVIDEIGPMELYSKRFKEMVKRVVEGRKLLIGTVHWNMRNQLIHEMKSRGDTEVFTLTYENREELPRKIIDKGVKYLRRDTKRS
jgi:nucleoside-triphosphatase